MVGDVVGWSGPNSKSKAGVAHSVRWERQRGSGKVPVSKSKETAHWRIPRPVTSRESLAKSGRRLKPARMMVRAFYHGDVVTAVTWDPEPPDTRRGLVEAVAQGGANPHLFRTG